MKSTHEINKKLTTVTATEELTEQRWKGFLPTAFISEEERQAHYAEYKKSKENNADHGKRLGKTLYASKGSRGYLFRVTYSVDESSDDEELMSTGLYVKLT